MNAPLVLASGSPRRAKILREHGVAFATLRTDAPETAYPREPERTVKENALLKWRAAIASGAVPSGVAVLAADTIVWYGDRIYGKPRDLEEAAAFLRTLSGHTHTVFTGVAYGRADEEPRLAAVASGVTFRALSEAEIADYVARVKPTDRAGAYDIDEAGDRIVASFDGEYENIMGLPIEPLRKWGVI